MIIFNGHCDQEDSQLETGQLVLDNEEVMILRLPVVK